MENEICLVGCTLRQKFHFLKTNLYYSWYNIKVWEMGLKRPNITANYTTRAGEIPKLLEWIVLMKIWKVKDVMTKPKSHFSLRSLKRAFCVWH